MAAALATRVPFLTASLPSQPGVAQRLRSARRKRTARSDVRSFATASDCSRARAAPRPTLSGKITGCSRHTIRVRVSPSSSEELSRGTYSLDVLAIAAEHCCASDVSLAFRSSNEHVDTFARITNDSLTSTIAFPFVVDSRVDSLTHGHTHASRVVMWRSCSLTRCNSLCVIQCEPRSSLQAFLLRSLTRTASKTAETCFPEPFRTCTFRVERSALLASARIQSTHEAASLLIL